MARKFAYVICLLSVIIFSGCTTLKQIGRPVVHAGKVVAIAVLPSYFGPKAHIAVTDFEVKSAKATGEIGTGLREALSSALVNSNRFSVTRQQVAGADLIIAVAVTEFEPETSGGKAGLGGGGGVGSGILGGLLGTALNKAYLALNIRIMDVSTSEVLKAVRVQGQASDTAGGFRADIFGKQGLVGGLAVYANTPMEKAIRICITEAVRNISQNIPVKYYKY